MQRRAVSLTQKTKGPFNWRKFAFCKWKFCSLWAGRFWKWLKYGLHAYKYTSLYMWLCKTILSNTEPDESLQVLLTTRLDKHMQWQDLLQFNLASRTSLAVVLCCTKKSWTLEERAAGRAKEETEGEKWEGQEAAAAQTAAKQQLWQGLHTQLFSVQSGYSCITNKEHRRGQIINKIV